MKRRRTKKGYGYYDGDGGSYYASYGYTQD